VGLIRKLGTSGSGWQWRVSFGTRVLRSHAAGEAATVLTAAEAIRLRMRRRERSIVT
jgi:hypothetical protein